MKQQIKNNKALLILPLGLLPFIILIFYILGGASKGMTEPSDRATSGVNHHLPEADHNITILDKKEAYQQIKEDEPQAELRLNVDTSQQLKPLGIGQNLSAVDVNKVVMEHVKKQEQLSRDALGQPNEIPEKRIVSKSTASNKTAINRRYQPSSIPKHNTTNKAYKKRTRHVITEQGESIELQELEGLIDEHQRLLIQKDSLHQQLQMAQQILTKQQQDQEAKLEVSVKRKSDFHQSNHTAHSIQAQVLEDCKVMSGNRIMLRLMNTVRIKDKTIHQGTLIYGLCKSDSERLQILITSIPYYQTFLPVSLCAFDLDGIRGLYIPDNAKRKVYKEVAGNVNPSVLLSPSNDPLSYMGINAANNLSQNVVKRVRLKRIHLRKNTVMHLKNQ